jgi:hypothetical protein
MKGEVMKLPNQSKLTNKQKSFIRARVESLGSVKQVEFDYRRDDLVSEYARSYAEKIFRKGE